MRSLHEGDMTPKQFSLALMQAVVEDNTEAYQDIFTSTAPEGASDRYWKRALTLFQSLSRDQQAVLFEIIRQVCVDTTSNVLGVIDGVNSVDGADEEFALIYGQNQKLNGDLQSLFLVEEERRAKAR